METDHVKRVTKKKVYLKTSDRQVINFVRTHTSWIIEEIADRENELFIIYNDEILIDKLSKK